MESKYSKVWARFGVWGLRALGSRCGLGFRFRLGFGVRVWGLGFRVQEEHHYSPDLQFRFFALACMQGSRLAKAIKLVHIVARHASRRVALRDANRIKPQP